MSHDDGLHFAPKLSMLSPAFFARLLLNEHWIALLFLCRIWWWSIIFDAFSKCSSLRNLSIFVKIGTRLMCVDCRGLSSVLYTGPIAISKSDVRNYILIVEHICWLSDLNCSTFARIRSIELMFEQAEIIKISGLVEIPRHDDEINVSTTFACARFNLQAHDRIDSL